MGVKVNVRWARRGVGGPLSPRRRSKTRERTPYIREKFVGEATVGRRPYREDYHHEIVCGECQCYQCYQYSIVVVVTVEPSTRRNPLLTFHNYFSIFSDIFPSEERSKISF